MSERERESTFNTLNDGDVEIIDLDTQSAPANRRPGQDDRKGRPYISAALLRRRPQRILVTVCLIVVALLVLVGSSPVMRSTALGLLFPVTMKTTVFTPPAESDVNQFYIEGVPPWGQILLDGQPLNIHTDEGIGQPLPIPRGHHVLRLHAEPFGPYSCTLTIPLDPSDTCHTTKADMQVSGTWVLSFNESLATLPQVYREALVQATQAVFNAQQSSTLVQAGERYVDLKAAGHVTQATQLLRAKLRFQLLVPSPGDLPCWPSTNTTSCITQLNNCTFFCTIPYMNVLPAASISWLVQVPFRASFDYTTLDNKAVASNQPDAMPDSAADPDLATLGITWDGTHWHVRIVGPILPAGNPIGCVTTENNAPESLLLQRMSTTLVNSIISSTVFQFAATPTPADGCLLALMLTTGSNTAPLPSTTAYFLYRFGLYQAANYLAHKLWPQLPQATSSGRNLAAKMAASLFTQ